LPLRIEEKRYGSAYKWNGRETGKGGNGTVSKAVMSIEAKAETKCSRLRPRPNPQVRGQNFGLKAS